MSLNESFMNRWKVAGELHRPKNITVGLNSPLLVMKAAFHWSPSRMQMLLYVIHHDGTTSLVQGLSRPYAGFYVNQKKLLVHHEHRHRMLEHGSGEYGGQGA